MVGRPLGTHLGIADLVQREFIGRLWSGANYKSHKARGSSRIFIPSPFLLISIHVLKMVCNCALTTLLKVDILKFYLWEQ
ncbi:hypothetical protein Lal_00025262 [Lupinus albus]|nr:hypothetical protein Lal_00025262 [Lupinus albus]